MKEKLTQLLQEGQEKIRAARSEGELQEVKGLLLGKPGRPDGPSEGAAPAGREPAAGDGQGREPGQDPADGAAGE